MVSLMCRPEYQFVVPSGEFFDRIVDDRYDGKGMGERLTKFYALQLLRAIEVRRWIGVARENEESSVSPLSRHHAS